MYVSTTYCDKMGAFIYDFIKEVPTNMEDHTAIYLLIDMLVNVFSSWVSKKTEVKSYGSKHYDNNEGINESDQNILNALYNNPVISNNDIANQVSLSYEGASSSLQKMYRLFEIKKTKNMKLALIIKATHITNS